MGEVAPQKHFPTVVFHLICIGRGVYITLDAKKKAEKLANRKCITLWLIFQGEMNQVPKS